LGSGKVAPSVGEESSVIGHFRQAPEALEKPDEVYELIERMYPEYDKRELFAVAPVRVGYHGATKCQR